MDYPTEIEKEACDFFRDFEEMITEAIAEGADWDRNDIKGLDLAFHENITDRAYTFQDAAWVIEHCENEETDSGLWEGQQPEEAISTKAAFSFSLDVWFECEKLYNTLKENYEARRETAEDETETETAQAVFAEWKKKGEIQPVKDKAEQIRLIERWLSLNEEAGLWGGYPVGSSYIDSRGGTGYGRPHLYDYVQFDHEIAAKIPAIRGKYRASVEAYLAELKK